MQIGLIGCGRMGGALIEGAIRAGVITPDKVLVSSRTAQSAQALASKLSVRVAASNKEVAAQCDLVLLGCKPYQVVDVLTEISSSLGENTVLLSVAAGITLDKMEACSPAGARIIRAMPNTPSLIGLGASGLAAGSHATDADMALARTLLESVGIVCTTTEPQLDAVTGLSGSGPAYVYTFIESLARQAEKEGLSGADALQLATRTVEGAAQMVNQTGMTPRKLIDQVTSPGGTTLAGLAALAENGFESSIAAGVHAATERSREIARES